MQPADASLLIGMILILFFNMLHVLKYCSTKSKFYMILFRYEAILDAIDSIYQEKNDRSRSSRLKDTADEQE